MACSIKYQAALFINEIDDKQFLSSIMRYAKTILLLTSSKDVNSKLEKMNFQVLYIDLEGEIDNDIVGKVESEKFIIYETRYIECGLIVDILKSCTRSPIFVIKKNKRFIPTIYHQKLGASFVIYTKDMTKLSFLIE
ncbi:hypothetical protein HXA31_07995 [Salipaludibacillus agaradhaerens]|uniref:Uncharacterized protein n=1 Tax=Salipaludibacillus agaradhaerens TaxID=76935 RepID=A0A9Q4B0I5_SALAG|nr:hypothetical protein [Salipaludibacillus agaradhaerens]MCR6096133.1 hypothetical protein [Salipaludibacillus agaradhaerens]MCR6114308.1 hypothetical protein [Salipaludibacillus agaradhaerens]